MVVRQRAHKRKKKGSFLFRNEMKHCPSKTCAKLAFAARPAQRKSPSTSCPAGEVPSVPTHPCVSRRDAATAFAAAHPSNQDHRVRHACSTRLCMSAVSLRAHAVASRVRHPFVSFENLLPTSTVRTTNRARACTPTNSGYLPSFVRNASYRTISRGRPPFWAQVLF